MSEHWSLCRGIVESRLWALVVGRCFALNTVKMAAFYEMQSTVNSVCVRVFSRVRASEGRNEANDMIRCGDTFFSFRPLALQQIRLEWLLCSVSGPIDALVREGPPCRMVHALSHMADLLLHSFVYFLCSFAFFFFFCLAFN